MEREGSFQDILVTVHSKKIPRLGIFFRPHIYIKKTGLQTFIVIILDNKNLCTWAF